LYQAGDILNTLWPLLRSQTKQSTVDRVHVRVENTIDFFETLATTACFELNPLGGFLGDKRVARAVLDVFPVTDRDVICSLGVVLRKLLAGEFRNLNRKGLLKMKGSNLTLMSCRCMFPYPNTRNQNQGSQAYGPLPST
jgi:hypothetical protein